MTTQSCQCPHVISLSSDPQLFLDDHCVGGTINLTRQMQQPLKHAGNPIIPRDQPWERWMLGGPSVIYDPATDLFHMRYSAWDSEQSKRNVVCYAQSPDGLEWRKVMTDDHPHNGQPSNIVGEPWYWIRTPDDQDRLYKGLTHSKFIQEKVDRGMYAIYSKDGSRWSKPIHVTGTKCDTLSSLVWFGAAEKYFVFTRSQMWHPQLYGHLRVTGIIESSDFEHWQPKRAVNLISEAEGFPYVQVHGLNAHEYGDILIGLIPIVHLQEKGNNFLGKFDIQLASSRHGWHWHRAADGAVFLPNGPENWDRWYVHSSSMARKKDTLYYYYMGRPQMHGAVRQMREQGVVFKTPIMTTDVGVATLAADRFVAMEQIDRDEPGILDTPPVRCNGRDLIVNAQLDPADLQVELIDEQGPVAQYQSEPLAGFERAHSKLVRQDDLRYRVVWTSDGTDRCVADAGDQQPFIVRFVLRKGELFAFQIV